MSYPLTFTPYDWENLPSESTAFDKENAQESEKRLAEFTEKYEIHWRAPVKKISNLSIYTPPNVQAGDVAFVEELHEIYYYNGSEWNPLTLHYWKEPVAEESKLPIIKNVIGDVRLNLETNQFYICYTTSGDISEQWKLFVPTSHTHTIETLTWSVAEAITTEPESIPGGFRRIATEETQKLYEVEFELAKGKVELELKVNGTAIKFEGGSTKVKVKTAAEALKLETAHTFTTKDKIELIVHSISEEPQGLAFSAFIEHISKAI